MPACKMRRIGDDEHNLALRYIEMISNAFGLRTFLDVGAGTGRGMRFLLDRGKEVRGVEPVAAMIEKAESNGGAERVTAAGQRI